MRAAKRRVGAAGGVPTAASLEGVRIGAEPAAHACVACLAAWYRCRGVVYRAAGKPDATGGARGIAR